MSALFSNDAVSLKEIQAAYDELSQQFRADLYVTHPGPAVAHHPVLVASGV